MSPAITIIANTGHHPPDYTVEGSASTFLPAVNHTSNVVYGAVDSDYLFGSFLQFSAFLLGQG